MGRFDRDNGSGGDRGPRKFGKRDFGGRGFSSSRGGFGGKPAMHQATCANCGNECQVPFKPTGNRPVFCSDCFDKQGGGNSTRPLGNSFSKPNFHKSSFSRSMNSGRDNDRKMFEAVCDKCGNDCQVPFQPTPGKPVFCDNCFEKGGSAGGRNTEHYRQQFEIINAKLEKIMKALNINTPEVVIEVKAKKEVVEKKETTKETSPKKNKKTVIKAKPATKKAVSKKKK